MRNKWISSVGGKSSSCRSEAFVSKATVQVCIVACLKSRESGRVDYYMLELLVSDCMPLIHRRHADGSIEFPLENSFRAWRLASPSNMIGFATLQISIFGSSAVLVVEIALMVLNSKTKREGVRNDTKWFQWVTPGEESIARPHT